MSTVVILREVAPDDPVLTPLIAAHLAHSEMTTPPESRFALDAVGLRSATGLRMWVAEDAGGALGCGALKPLGDGVAEVKSVHVLAAARGRGLARQIMDRIIAEARASGITALYLETGSDKLTGFEAARALYDRLGFTPCDPFGTYGPDPLSAFFRRDL